MKDKLLIIAAILVIAASVVGYYQIQDIPQIVSILLVVAGTIAGVVLVSLTEIGKGAWTFIKGANVERQKVVWPTRQEAAQVTLMVIILVIILGLLMWVFDALSFYAIYDIILRVRGA